MNQHFASYTFTNSVKKAQEKYGSRQIYQKMDTAREEPLELTQREVSFIVERDEFYMATVSENGWPYVQYRGGPKGFLKIIGDQTIGFADYRGNMQYISTGNIDANRKVALILLDYPTRRRMKIWAEAEILDPAEHHLLSQKLVDKDYNAVVERLFVMHIKAYDWNCPQHITQRYTLDEIKSDLLPNNPDIIEDCCPDYIKTKSHSNYSNDQS